jgi:hypothetical protein
MSSAQFSSSLLPNLVLSSLSKLDILWVELKVIGNSLPPLLWNLHLGDDVFFGI